MQAEAKKNICCFSFSDLKTVVLEQSAFEVCGKNKQRVYWKKSVPRKTMISSPELAMSRLSRLLLCSLKRHDWRYRISLSVICWCTSLLV